MSERRSAISTFTRLSATRFGRELTRIGVSRRSRAMRGGAVTRWRFSVRDRLRAIDQPARPDALAAGRLAVEQTKPLRAAHGTAGK